MEPRIEEILRKFPCLFLLNKKDSDKFKGLEYIESKLGLREINCVETVSLPISALDMSGVDSALSWIYRAVYENSL